MSFTVAEDTNTPRKLAPGDNWVRCLITPDSDYAAGGETLAIGTALDVTYAYEMKDPTPMGGYKPEFVPDATNGADRGKLVVRRCAADDNPMEETADHSDLHLLPFYAWFRVG